MYGALKSFRLGMAGTGKMCSGARAAPWVLMSGNLDAWIAIVPRGLVRQTKL